MPQPHVQVILGDTALPDPLEAALRRAPITASFRPLADALKNGLAPSADAVVVVVPDDSRALTQRLKILFDRLADQPRATLVLRNGGGPPPRLAHPPTVPVSFAADPSAEELAVRLAVMLEMRPSLDSLHQDMMVRRRSGETAAQGYLDQLRLASRIQRDFLPAAALRHGPLSFTTIFRPADHVSGDIYDIQRLDEEHVGIALADATGRGIPAALLTVFIKRALRGKERLDNHYRVLPPHEVLARLNEDVLEANLSECRFVAATYALVNLRTLQLSVARGGSPYPLLRRADGTTKMLRPAGGMVGVLPDAPFAVETVQLQRGDALLLYSDGLEKLAAPEISTHALARAFAQAAQMARGGHAITSATSTAILETPDDGAASPDEFLTSSLWHTLLREKGIPAALDHLVTRYEAVRRLGPLPDDLTAVAMEVMEND